MKTPRFLFEKWLLARSPFITRSSADCYRQQFETFLRFLEAQGLSIRQIKLAHIEKWMALAKLEHKNKGAVIIAKLTVFKAFFAWCVAERHMKINPVDRARLPRIVGEMPHKEPFTYEQYRRVRLYSRSKERFFRFWPAACAVAWHTGMRKSDVASLKWQHVNFDDGVIVFEPLKMRSHGQRLTVPIEPEFRTHLLSLFNSKLDPVYVVPYQMHTYANSLHLPSQFRTICNHCQLPHHSFHSFRHGFVTRLLNAGVDPITIGSLTGQGLQQLSEYAHVSIEAKLTALNLACTQAITDTEPNAVIKYSNILPLTDEGRLFQGGAA